MASAGANSVRTRTVALLPRPLREPRAAGRSAEIARTTRCGGGRRAAVRSCGRSAARWRSKRSARALGRFAGGLSERSCCSASDGCFLFPEEAGDGRCVSGKNLRRSRPGMGPRVQLVQLTCARWKPARAINLTCGHREGRTKWWWRLVCGSRASDDPSAASCSTWKDGNTRAPRTATPHAFCGGPGGARDGARPGSSSPGQPVPRSSPTGSSPKREAGAERSPPRDWRGDAGLAG